MDVNNGIGLTVVGDRYESCFAYLEEARSGFMRVPGVLGVGIGPKETKGLINASDPCLIVYVESKKPRTMLPAAELIPSEYRGVKVDVVELGRRYMPIHNEFDAVWLNNEPCNGADASRGVGYVY